MCEGKYQCGMNIGLAEWRCHGENALKHDRDLEDESVKKVKPSVCLAQGGHLPLPASDRNGYENHGQRVTVWNVTFSDVPEGPQDHEEALMEAIECYVQFKADEQPLWPVLVL
jgi:hypothetical protein